MKLRRCKNCKERFEPLQPLQYVCGYKCANEYQKLLKTNKEAKEWRVKKAQMKSDLLTHKDYIKMLQVVFNAFIRERDKSLSCISCGTTKNVEYAAGHFYPTTYQFLRFNEDNVHKQCNKHCNMMLRGNINEYRPNLEKKIGFERLQWLHHNRHNRLELSIPELKELIKEYKL